MKNKESEKKNALKKGWALFGNWDLVHKYFQLSLVSLYFLCKPWFPLSLKWNCANSIKIFSLANKDNLGNVFQIIVNTLVSIVSYTIFFFLCKKKNNIAVYSCCITFFHNKSRIRRMLLSKILFWNTYFQFFSYKITFHQSWKYPPAKLEAKHLLSCF